MTDAEKIEAEIQQLIAGFDTDYDSILPDLIAEKIKVYGELRYDRGWDDGYEAGHGN